MNELDKRQKEILEAWKRGESVKGWGGEFGIENALINAVSGEHSKIIAKSTQSADFATLGLWINRAILTIARELAAFQMGYAYLDDAEYEMKENACNNAQD